MHFIPGLNKFDEGGVLNWAMSVCPSIDLSPTLPTESLRQIEQCAHNFWSIILDWHIQNGFGRRLIETHLWLTPPPTLARFLNDMSLGVKSHMDLYNINCMFVV